MKVLKTELNMDLQLTESSLELTAKIQEIVYFLLNQNCQNSVRFK